MLPFNPTRSKSGETLIREVENGMEIEVEKTTRASKTRSPVHNHPYGGVTCVLEGEMTLYL